MREPDLERLKTSISSVRRHTGGLWRYGRNEGDTTCFESDATSSSIVVQACTRHRHVDVE
jgi:hypothetical protein